MVRAAIAVRLALCRRPIERLVIPSPAPTVERRRLREPMLRSRSRRGLAMTTQLDLQQEILRLTQIIDANRAALRTPTVSDADKAQLRLSIGQRKARLATLQVQMAANSN